MLISEDVYKIDFAILENNNPKTLVIFDQSNYLTPAISPTLFITLPGYKDPIQVPYIAQSNRVSSLNSNDLGLTSSEVGNSSDLPDGLYQIKMAVVPFDELYRQVCHLRTTDLECKFNNLLLNVGSQGCVDERELEKEIISIDVLIMSAKAETTICNIGRATDKYQRALKKIETLNKKLNCK